MKYWSVGELQVFQCIDQIYSQYVIRQTRSEPGLPVCFRVQRENKASVSSVRTAGRGFTRSPVCSPGAHVAMATCRHSTTAPELSLSLQLHRVQAGRLTVSCPVSGVFKDPRRSRDPQFGHLYTRPHWVKQIYKHQAV